MTELGRLESIKLRDIWHSEDQSFTPWLAQEENIDLLGKTLGLELEIEAQEKEVGPFRADILCKDISDDSWVLIENQLERTDHKHLGQLLTYAAGLKAVTILWIAAKFTEENRATLDWLNQITDDSFSFFGLEVELWRIEKSPPAPKFNIISSPNGWSRLVGAASRRIEQEALTQTKKLQLKFWTQLDRKLSNHPYLRTQEPRPHGITRVPIGRSGMRLGGILNTRENRLGVELYLQDENAQTFFQQLEDEKKEIESSLGFSPDWKELPHRRASRIIYYLQQAPLDDVNRWDEYLDWVVDKLEKFYSTFQPRVKLLSIEPTENEDLIDTE